MPTRRQRGEGSVSQRCDTARGCPPAVDRKRPPHKCKGLWVGMIDLGERDGKRRRRAVYGQTQAEAVRKLQKARADIAQYGVADSRPMTVERWLRHYLEEIAPHEVKASTLSGSYNSKIERAIQTIGRRRLDKLEPDHLRALYKEMAAECSRPRCGLTEDQHAGLDHEFRGRGQSSIEQTHRILAHAFTVAKQNKKLTGPNPAAREQMKTPNVGRGATEARPFAPRHVLTLLSSIQGHRLESRWLLALTLGARQGELLGIGWEDIDWEARTIHIQRSLTRVKGKGLRFVTPKSPRSQRTLPLSPWLLASLARRKEAFDAEAVDPAYCYDPAAYGPLAPSGLVWGKPDGRPRDGKEDWDDWSDLLAAAEVPHMGTHAARHTVGTLLSAKGAPVKVAQNLLGHSQVSLTLNVYTHADVEAMRPWVDQLDAALSGDRAALQA